MSGVVSLGNVLEQAKHSVGGKVYALAFLAREGFTIPKLFALPLSVMSLS